MLENQPNKEPIEVDINQVDHLRQGAESAPHPTLKGEENNGNVEGKYVKIEPKNMQENPNAESPNTK